MTDDPTLFQQLVNNDEVPNMISDLEDVDEDNVDRWELALSFTAEDLPRILEELRELDNDDQ